MMKKTSIRGIAVAAVGLLAAATLMPEDTRANFAGDTAQLTVFLDGGPVVDMIEIGPGLEIQSGDSTNLGAVLRPGESVDCDNTGCVFTLQPMQTAFVLSDLDGPVLREIEAITLGGTLLPSSNAETSTDNTGGTSGTRFTVDCNPFLTPACTGGTVVVTFVLAPVSGGDALQATKDLKQAVIDQGFIPSTQNPLLAKLNGAINKLEDGNPDNDDAAISKLMDFNDTVAAKQEMGSIGPIGDALIAVADDIIELIQAA